MPAILDASAASAGLVHACSAIQVDTNRADFLAVRAKDSRRAKAKGLDEIFDGAAEDPE
jgi:hypothetical protein